MVNTGNTKEWVWYAFVCRSTHVVTITVYTGSAMAYKQASGQRAGMQAGSVKAGKQASRECAQVLYSRAIASCTIVMAHPKAAVKAIREGVRAAGWGRPGKLLQGQWQRQRQQ
jgi:hypothetical protein